jgi:hypothetical protein
LILLSSAKAAEVSDDLKKQREDAKKTAKEMAEQGKSRFVLQQHKDGIAGTDWRYRHCRRPDELCEKHHF